VRAFACLAVEPHRDKVNSVVPADHQIHVRFANRAIRLAADVYAFPSGTVVAALPQTRTLFQVPVSSSVHGRACQDGPRAPSRQAFSMPLNCSLRAAY
jgi:hypothetical protein